MQGGSVAAGGGLPMVAVAVDKDKGSQNALKWAIENLSTKSQTIVLVHVNTRTLGGQQEVCMKEVIMPFRCFCTRKNVHCKDVVLEDTDVAKAIVEFISQAAIEKLVLGASSRSGFVRFKSSDTPTTISRAAPDFCTVYIVSKGKVSSVRNAVRSAPAASIQVQNQASLKPEPIDQPRSNSIRGEPALETRKHHEESDSIMSPFARGMHGYKKKSYGEISLPDTDISFVSCSSRPNTERFYPQGLSNASDYLDYSFETQRCSYMMDSDIYGSEFSSFSQDSFMSQPIDDAEAEMNRLRLELKQTMDMYSTACREALTAKQKATELHRWKTEEEHRLQEAQLAGNAALAMAEKERARYRAALEAAEASKRIAQLEAQKKMYAEMQAHNEGEDRKKASDSLLANLRYRKYTIEEIEEATEHFAKNRKIGEGGYGPVYKCYLDHTPVAIKVLRPDAAQAAQGRSQFQQEVEILSCIRHPNMVLLLGACPEFGCLVYEYMANGSLEDRLFRVGNTPPIPWQDRFRIAAEIGTGLLFLHQTKPEPLVHRDLKPANILLDRNYGCKISDVGLARLVPPSVADTVTQYRMTATAGTFCYIDPEYQQSGMLGIKSDVYSLGIMLLQLVTGKPPMGLTHHVECAIEEGRFEEMLDPTVPDWPVEDATRLAQIALKCAELRRKDRPDLAKVVLPELERLRALGEENTQHCVVESKHSSPTLSQVSVLDVTSCSLSLQSSYESSISQSSTSSTTEKSMGAI